MGQAWFDNAALEIQFGIPGLVPAVLCAYDPDTKRDYFYESLSDPWPDPAPRVKVPETWPSIDHRNLAFHYAVYGQPVGFSKSPEAEFYGVRGTLIGTQTHWVSYGETQEIVEVTYVYESASERCLLKTNPKGRVVEMRTRSFAQTY